MGPGDEGDAHHSVTMSAEEGLQKYGNCLTPYERTEIASYTNIYYCGQRCENKIKAPTSGPNDGFDTSEGEYIFRANDHIAYRYEILEEVGSGAFGQVLKAIDHVDGEIVAVKLIRNQRKVLQQAVQEIKILEYINTRDPKNLYGVVRMIESFAFRGHTCISYELLGTNLYEYLKEKEFYPMALSIIRGIAARMLVTLTFLGRENIMHCDLKPENILIRGADPSVVKLVDLGSASFDQKNSFMYIQSRFYRAPEVILEQRYTKAIDWWSLGCILCELANGDPVFPGNDEKDQLGCIMEYLGPPPQSFVEASSARKKRQFFDEHLQPREQQSKKGRVRMPGSKSLAKFLGVPEDDDFLSFVMQFLQWDPAARVPPREAMRHKWISSEFVFPTKTDEQDTAASSSKAGVAASAAPPEANNNKNNEAAAPARVARGKPAWQARFAAAGGETVGSTARSVGQAIPEPAARAMRQHVLPRDGHHTPGVAPPPPLTNSNDGVTPRATAVSCGGAPRRPSASQRRGGSGVRGRHRRSTDMAEVEMPGEATLSASATTADATTEEESSRDFLTAADGGGTSALNSGSTVSRDRPPPSSAKQRALPALKPGGLSSAVLSMSAHPVVVTVAHQTQQSSAALKRESGDVAGTGVVSGADPSGTITTTAVLLSRSNANSVTDPPSSTERGNRVLELRRAFEAENGHAANTGEREHLEGSTRSGPNGVLRFANMVGNNSTEKDPSHGSMSSSAKQRSVHEPEPTTPPRTAKGKVPGARRQEYSLTIDRTPTPPPLEPPSAAERPRAHTKERTIPTVAGPEVVSRNFSLLSASRPHEPGSSFMYAGRYANHSPTGDMRSSGETVILSSPPSAPSGPGSVVGALAGAASRPAQESTVSRRTTQRRMLAGQDGDSKDLSGRQDREAAPDAGSGDANGRQPSVSAGMVRLAQTRQPLAHRQRLNLVSTLGEGNRSASPTTVLPPLKRNSIR